MTVKTRTQINSDADTYLADNTSADISPEDVRQRVKDLADSALFEPSDPGADRLLGWDESAGESKFFPLADLTTEAAPAAGDYVIIYGAEGDVRKVNWNLLPGAGGGIANVVEDTTPQLGGDLDPNGFGVSAGWNPATSDGAALGSATKMWSDLFLASGGVVNFNNGNITITHSAGNLTFAGGVLVLPDAGLKVGASVPFSDSAGVLTLQNVDALDAATEATIEAAIDALANLTGIQGLTVTLIDAGVDALFGWDESAAAYQNLSAADARAAIGLATTDSPQFAGVNVGAAGDTTITRTGAGDIAVEGNAIYRAGGTDVPVADGGTGASSAAGAATNLGLGTGDSPQFAAVNIGHASDTTLARVSAGQVAVEGVPVKLAAPRVITNADQATLTIDADSYDQAQQTAQAQALTIAAPTGTPANGQTLIIRLKDNGTGRALSWNAIFRAIGVTLPTTTVANKTHYIGARYNSADTKWDVLAVGAEA